MMRARNGARSRCISGAGLTMFRRRAAKACSVRLSNCGPLGWVSDHEQGYRYQATHPQTRAAWPTFPPEVLAAWIDIGGYPHEPEACLINYYASDARMSLHQDRDEGDF